jgi:hypothetical protein
MQIAMFDPKETATVTAAMLSDPYLKYGIQFVRRHQRDASDRFEWPYVEALCEIDRQQVWVVDDQGLRYVVVGPIIFGVADLHIADEKIRTAAVEAFARLDIATINTNSERPA